MMLQPAPAMVTCTTRMPGVVHRLSQGLRQRGLMRGIMGQKLARQLVKPVRQQQAACRTLRPAPAAAAATMHVAGVLAGAGGMGPLEAGVVVRDQVGVLRHTWGRMGSMVAGAGGAGAGVVPAQASCPCLHSSSSGCRGVPAAAPMA